MATVRVGCKLPSGIEIHLPAKKGEELKVVRLNGFATKRGIAVPHQIVGGYGMTDVDESFWQAWEKAARAAKFPPLVNGLIFAEEDAKVADLEALDKSSLRSGLEPLDPTKPGAGLQPDDDQAQRRPTVS